MNAFLGPHRSASTFHYYDVGPHYRPIDGYIPQSDLRGYDLRGYEVNGSLASAQKPADAIRKLAISASADRYIDASGNVRLADSEITGNVTLPNLLNVAVDRSLSSLRTYLVGYPVYSNGVALLNNQSSVSLSYRVGLPNTASASYAWGVYSNVCLQQLTTSFNHRLSRRFSGEFDYDAVDERPNDEAQQSQVPTPEYHRRPLAGRESEPRVSCHHGARWLFKSREQFRFGLQPSFR